MRKRPDYGNATPGDLARALMSERLKTIRYRRSVAGKKGASLSDQPQPASSDPECRAGASCDSPQTHGRNDQDA